MTIYPPISKQNLHSILDTLVQTHKHGLMNIDLQHALAPQPFYTMWLPVHNLVLLLPHTYKQNLMRIEHQHALVRQPFDTT